MSETERAALDPSRKPARGYGAGALLFSENEPCTEIFQVREGWALTSRLLADGRRQVIDIFLPGDVLGLFPHARATMPCAAEAVTPVSVWVFDHARLLTCLTASPRMSRHALSLFAGHNAALSEHLVNIGRRTAIERVAAFLLELFDRSQRAGLTDGPVCPCPLTQTDIGDALGLSNVHVSRTLTRLRQAGIARVANGTLHLLDRPRLHALYNS
ncbi:cAMP-binding domain of CRP or a regulatory subunit of cAMP-dependent protein kinases [Limimonas halophila]|uniref:cAMP-binding domain of CRP or a regulatory subunit of cAMP-dependent protein kinases n=1 Tax=Limimonas halophila TaxID=1082479 RepID=A0A1G7NRZ2_9PROT|nr:Crp/Fnr family transcriptional regulator [Limimonas halophila]SDF76741.1 cAMP-binding domain of CRP or a regulatory subunit of cAMP-dependent protein kinases [Limimonas halophila]